jgi:TonB family protein
MRLFCILLAITGVFLLGASAQKNADPTPQPTLISAPQPVYPKEAKEAGIGGKITVRVVVDETGAIVSVDSATGPAQVCGSGDDDPRITELREAVIEAIKRAKFSPAMKDGQPVKSISYLSSSFDPEDQAQDPLPPGEKKIVKLGMLAGRAVSLPKPEYPRAARATRASGAVSVKILINEAGSVITARAVSGHPLLRRSAEIAACRARYTPTIVDGRPARVSGIITYNFVP